jgi:polyhydroxyalkanoate synthesis regulator phasin
MECERKDIEAIERELTYSNDNRKEIFKHLLESLNDLQAKNDKLQKELGCLYKKNELIEEQNLFAQELVQDIKKYVQTTSSRSPNEIKKEMLKMFDDSMFEY